METKNTCFVRTNKVADCKFVKYCLDRRHMACFHANRNMSDTERPRKIGRDVYCYPYAYDECDCGGYEPDMNPIKLFFLKIKITIKKYFNNDRLQK